MQLKPKYKRLINILVFIGVIALGVFLIAKGFRDNIVFFITPSEIKDKHYSEKKLRVGGIVIKDSVIKKPNASFSFTLTDYVGQVRVNYQGILPDLFREEQAIVVEGSLLQGNPPLVQAQNVLAKHDENYRPPEIAKKLGGKVTVSQFK